MLLLDYHPCHSDFPGHDPSMKVNENGREVRMLLAGVAEAT
jgi:hypothetical protein